MSSGPARRAVIRWAWRLFRREWRQQLQVLILLTVAVAGAVAMGTMAVNAGTPLEGQFGAGNALTRVRIEGAVTEERAVAEAKRQFGTIEVISHRSITAPGTTSSLDVRAQDPRGDLGKPMLRLVEGRYPVGRDEAAVTDDVASTLGIDIGDTVDIGGTAQRVVGRVENPGDLRDDFVLVAPGALEGADSLTILLTKAGGRDSVGPPSGQPMSFAVLGAGDDEASIVAAVVMATAASMLLAALVAGAGFLVVGHRRQRQLGMLAAIGATERHQRLVMVANGAIVGAVASVMGAAIGIAVWLVSAPAIETAARHRIDRLDLPWAVIAQCVLFALVAAVAAAWWPARNLSRRPILAALSRRPLRTAPVHRSTLASLVLIIGGVIGILTSGIDTDSVRPPALIGGVAAIVVGVVFAAPLAIRVVVAPAGRFPFSARLALRDLGRHQGRAAAALAAITLGLGVCVTVVVAARASEYRVDEGNLSDRQLIVRSAGAVGAPPDAAPAETEQSGLDATASDIATAIGATARVPLDVAINPNASMASGRAAVTVARPLDTRSFRFVGPAYVATPELLRALDLADHVTAEEASVDLLTSLPGELVLLDGSGRGPQTPVVEHVSLDAYTSAPRALVTGSAMAERGWQAVRAGWLLTTERPISDEERLEAQRLAAASGAAVEVRAAQDDLVALRRVATAVGVLLALIIVTLTVGLIRSESAGDVRTLTATGAPPRARRALAAATAGSLAAAGVVLGTLGAYVVLAAAYHATLERLATPPVTSLLLVAVGTPVLAVGAGWAVAGREPHHFARQILD